MEKFMISPTALFYVPLIYYKHLYKASHKTNQWSFFCRHFTRSAKVYSSDFNAFSNKDKAIVNSVHKWDVILQTKMYLKTGCNKLVSFTKTLKTTHILIICFNSSLSIKQINTEYCLVGFDTMQSGWCSLT